MNWDNWDVEKNVLQICEEGIEDSKDWIEHGREKSHGVWYGNHYEKAVEEEKAKLAGYESVKKVLEGGEVSVEEAKDTYEYWKERTAGQLACLRLNVKAYMKQATDVWQRFLLTSVMKDYLGEREATAQDEKPENEDSNVSPETAEESAKRKKDIAEEAKKYLQTIKQARMGLNVGERETKKLLADMGMSLEEPNKEGLSLNYEQLTWITDIGKEEGEKIVDFMNAVPWLLAWDESKHGFVLERMLGKHHADPAKKELKDYAKEAHPHQMLDQEGDWEPENENMVDGTETKKSK